MDRLNKILIGLVLFFSITGVLSSLVLTVELIHYLENPEIDLNCNINSYISCGPVMQSEQSRVFGFPNQLIGLISYSVFGTLGVLYFADKKLNRIISVIANIGAAGAFIFSYWLWYQSMYVIGALCPYCLISTLSATVIFFALTLFNLNENNFGLNKQTNIRIKKFVDNGWYITPVILWFLIILGLMIAKYADAF